MKIKVSLLILLAMPLFGIHGVDFRPVAEFCTESWQVACAVGKEVNYISFLADRGARDSWDMHGAYDPTDWPIEFTDGTYESKSRKLAIQATVVSLRELERELEEVGEAIGQIFDLLMIIQD